MFFKEIVEMGHFRKTQGVSDFGHIPFAVLQQDFCLLQQALGNDLGGRFLGRILDGPVEVVDVDVQLVRKVGGGAQVDAWMVFLDGELAFQQLQKQHGNPPGSIYLLFAQLRGRLHFHGKMQEFKNKVSQHIVLVDIVGLDFIKHLLIHYAQLLHLVVRQFKHMIPGWLKYRILI